MTGGDSGGVSDFALTLNGRAMAEVSLSDQGARPSGRPFPVSELQFVGFSVSPRRPDVEYGVAIGDVVLPKGHAIGPGVYWEDGLHFESTRGVVWVELRSRHSGSSGVWSVRARLAVNVVPTKLGEERYETLVTEIRRTAAGLMFDVVSKMLRGVRYSRGITRMVTLASHLELASIGLLWRDLAGSLESILKEPHLRAGRSIELRTYCGSGALDPGTASRLAGRGVDPRGGDRGSPTTVAMEVLTRSGDTPEHRVVLWFLRLLLQRVRECLGSARRQVELIEADRELRHVDLGGGPTLYEEVDVPRIRRLRDAIARGRKLEARIHRATRAPLFQGVRPQHGDAETPVFQHVDGYRRFRAAMRHFMEASLVALEEGEDERLKSTSRLYEHWVFLRLAKAFRECGLRGGDVRGVVRRQARHRFVLDLDDDVIVAFHAEHGGVVRLRYEPWILPWETARRRGESLCRGLAGPAPAWRPDVLVEFVLDGEVQYAVVVDSKYSARVREDQWARVEKYAQIRTVAGRRQVVRQVWVAHPGEATGIRCRDAAVTWTEYGPDRPLEETIMGELGLRPAAAEDDDGPADVAREFAMGLLRYVGFVAQG